MKESCPIINPATVANYLNVYYRVEPCSAVFRLCSTLHCDKVSAC